MTEFELIDIVLASSTLNVFTPNKPEQEKVTNLAYSCVTDIQRDENGTYAFCFPSVEIKVIEKKEENDETESKHDVLLEIDISYFVGFEIGDSDFSDEKLKEFFEKKATDIIGPHLNHDIGVYLTKSSYPPFFIYDFKDELNDGEGD